MFYNCLILILVKYINKQINTGQATQFKIELHRVQLNTPAHNF